MYFCSKLDREMQIAKVGDTERKRERERARERRGDEEVKQEKGEAFFNA